MILRRAKMRTGIGLAAVLAAIAMACGTAVSSARTTKATTTAGQTLTTWDAETGTGGAIEQLNAEFQKKYGVKIHRVRYTFNDLKTKLRLGLSGPNAPDVVQLAGIGAIGSIIVKAHLLTNLDSYAAKYGWHKRFTSSFLSYGTFTPDGVIGKGNLYAVGQKAEFVGVFYSRRRLKQLGFSVPKTLGDFEQILAAAKKAGNDPILFPDAEGWPGSHELQALVNVSAGSQSRNVAKFALGQTGPAITGPLTQAATTLEAWQTAGYLGSSSLSASYNDAVTTFAKGNSIFLITGTWLGADLSKAMPKDIGVFLLPPVAAGGPVVATGTESTPWGIPAKSKQADLAAKYIDFITNAHAATLLAKNGDLPGATSAYHPPKGTVQASFIALYGSLVKSNGLIPYMDNATATMGGKVIYPGVQELIGGKTTPDQLAAAMQKDHDSAQSGG